MKSITIDNTERVPGTYTYEALNVIIDEADLYIILRNGTRTATCFVARPMQVEAVFSDIVYGYTIQWM